MNDSEKNIVRRIWDEQGNPPYIYYINAINTETFNEYVKRNSGAIAGILSDIEFHEWFERLAQWVEKEFRTTR